MKYSGGCRVFQELTTVEVVKKLFEEHGFSGLLEDRLSQSYVKRPYCVQYGESDQQFLQRLMEEDGIHYFFEYEQGKHTLILADDISSHKPWSDDATIPFRNVVHRGARESFNTLSAVKEFGIGTVALNDYDFQKPTSPLVVKQKSPNRDTPMEWYSFPGRYEVVDDGQRFARIRMEAEDAASDVVHMTGNACGVRSGSLFTLGDHPYETNNIQYLVTSASLNVQASSVQPADQRVFDCRVSVGCQSTKSPFRSALVTPRPVMRGPHLATVTGKAGEEIWTDSYGRIKVQFPWDREGKNDEQSSCWIRVSQSTTGKNWGTMSIPRIGEEVIVEFLDGNPDRPIVTGRVYNAQRMPPETLATAQAKTVFRTRSTKDADATAFHELTFDDTKGSESILFQSERDFTRIVENNDILKVGFEKTTPGDRTIEIYNNQKVTVGLGSGNGTYTLEAAKSILLKCGSSTIELTPQGITLTATSITLKASDALTAQAASVTAKSDAAMTFNAGADATLQGGGNVTIKGALVKIN
jgi:type VI secretion system secreted protein VgrG